jgi:general L-amino acid transport system substrate-binding protein
VTPLLLPFVSNVQPVTPDLTEVNVFEPIYSRLTLGNPDDYVILPEVISKEPLGPWVRQGDDQWFDIVRWTVFALVNAEEAGVTKDNAEAMRASTNPDVRRRLGQEGEFGPALGLPKDWAFNIVRSVGNYGEIFDRNLGPKTSLALDRGLNKLWSKGGILYAPPMR